jgi:hypothetical protein
LRPCSAWTGRVEPCGWLLAWYTALGEGHGNIAR